MRYHHQRRDVYVEYGETYICNHPLYSKCTLFKENDGRGVAVIQQRFDPVEKTTYWTDIDPDLTMDLYLNENYRNFMRLRARLPTDGLYPTVSIRQMMNAMKMKPLIKEEWETVFDRKDI